VEGRVDLGTGLKVRSQYPRLHIAAAIALKHNRPRRDSNLGLLTPQYRRTNLSATATWIFVVGAQHAVYSHSGAGGTTVHDTHSCSQHCLVLELVGLA